DPACDAFLNLRKALEGAPWDMRRVSEYYQGRLHETGRGVARDATRALQWYQEACKGGEPRGCEAATRLGGPARSRAATKRSDVPMLRWPASWPRSWTRGTSGWWPRSRARRASRARPTA